MTQRSSIQVGDAWDAIETFFEQGLTDGLPVVPPTEELVSRFLDASGLEPDAVVGEVPTRSLRITARTVAVNAVMAGCRPEYLPVVNAAVEAICDPEFNIHGASVSTGGSAQLIIVNGPVVDDLGMNPGPNVLGPGNRANSTIGRGVRLVVINAVGSKPGVVDMSCLGHGGKYSFCLPENEAESPWEPLHVDNGFPRDVSTVTVISSQGAHQVHDRMGGDSSGIVESIADSMVACGPGFKSFVVLLGLEPASLLARDGHSKTDVKQALFERAQRSAADHKRAGKMQGQVELEDESTMVPTVPEPDAITVIVAGGQAGRFDAIIPPWGKGHASVTQTRVIKTIGYRGAR